MPSGVKASALNGTMDAAAVEAALAAKSVHAGEVAADDLARLRQRADKGAAVEAMEAKMAEVTSREATAYHCAQCDRTTDREPTMCRAEGHLVTTFRRTQHRFRCDNCGFLRYAPRPTLVEPCTRCSKAVWKPASIFRVHGTSAVLDSTPRLAPTGAAVEDSLRTGTMFVPRGVPDADD